MKFQIARADQLYEEANQGIQYLHPRGRRGVKAGSDLYRMILRKIEEQGYDVFRKRARTTMFEKIRCIL
jgi:phytoene synthase